MVTIKLLTVVATKVPNSKNADLVLIKAPRLSLVIAADIMVYAGIILPAAKIKKVAQIIITIGIVAFCICVVKIIGIKDKKSKVIKVVLLPILSDIFPIIGDVITVTIPPIKYIIGIQV